ncbi:MAG: hypothetical protein ACP5K5_00435 [Candidatus Micrarchaeia archaeon]
MPTIEKPNDVRLRHEAVKENASVTENRNEFSKDKNRISDIPTNENILKPKEYIKAGKATIVAGMLWMAASVVVLAQSSLIILAVDISAVAALGVAGFAFLQHGSGF